MVFRVELTFMDGSRAIIDLCDTEEQFKTITVEQLRVKIKDYFGYPPDSYRLIFNGQQMKGERLLCDYGVQHMTTITTLWMLRGGSRVTLETAIGGKGDKDKSGSMERLSEF